MNGRKIAALLIGVTIAATLVTPIANVVGDGTGVQSVDNTTTTADVGNYSEDLEGYDVHTDSESVVWFNSSSGSNETLTEGTDYEFDYEDARVKILSGSNVQDGDTLYVSYDYQATDATVATIGNLVPMFVVLLILVTIGNKLRV